MAAGRGSRMIPLTNDLPKAMAPYEGSTLIANGIKRLKPSVKYIYVTVGYKGAILDIGVSGLFDTSGKDNGWWIFNTLMMELDKPIFVLTCDNITQLDFNMISKEYFKFGSPAGMIVPVAPIDGIEGDYIFHEDNKIKSLSRERKSDIYCSGIQVINPSKVNKIVKPADNFYDIWSQLIIKNELYCSNVYPKKWYTADTLEQLKNIPKGA
jgi:NDP-sugar pyrophosphorylase family protein